MQSKLLLLAAVAFSIASCTKTFDREADNSIVNADNAEAVSAENASAFVEIGSIDLGDAGAAEISAYDPNTKKLFVVHNAAINKIDVVNLSNPAAPVFITAIDLTPFGGLVNSLVAKNGFLAAAIEASDKVSDGKVVVFSTNDYTVIKEVTVGALPDMVTASDDGKFIMTANEGEPNSYGEAGSVDPVGSVSIISVDDNFSVTTLDFAAFAGQQAQLEAGGFRIFGPGASFAQDVEPEYVTISSDSKTAWVTLQENNGIAKVDLLSKTITNIFPLGLKNYNRPRNAFDPSDKDGGFNPANWNVKGMYNPDAIAVLEAEGIPYLFTANEGDARDYDGFGEEAAVKDADYVLDPVKFPDAATLKTDAQLGRLTVTTTEGDTDNDGDYDNIVSFGARSFSIWNGLNGALVYDCGSELETKTQEAGYYDDGRSDNKGVEPEAVAIGVVGQKRFAFIGMERADALAVYDITFPGRPLFSHVLKTGDGPEGVLFVKKNQSPDNRSLVIVSSENDGVVKIYAPAN